MSPVHDRRLAAIVDHLSAHFDAVAYPNGAARRDVDVIDDLHRTRRRRSIERLVRAVRARAVKVSRG